MSTVENPRRPNPIALVILCASAYLILYNLDQTPFWDDEAQVGMMANNLLDRGHITGWDGRNLFAYRNGRSLDENLRPRTPPLDYVVTAGSFALLGRTTWAGRLPYAVASLLTLVILIDLVRRRAPKSPAMWCYLAALLGLAPLFVLNARQCRYNALCMLFATTALYGFERYFEDERRRPGWLAVLWASSVLLFYAHFLMGGAFLVALAITFLAFHARKATVRDWVGLCVAGIAFLACTVPYVLEFRVWVRPDMTVSEPWLLRHVKLVLWNLRDLNFTGMLPWTVGLVAFGLLRHGPRPEPGMTRLASQCLVLGLAFTAVIGLVSPQPTHVHTFADVRYLVAVIPILAVPTAYVVWMAHRRSAVLGVGLAAVLVCCNAGSMIPGLTQFRWLLPAYVAEIHNPHPTSIGETIAYLEEHSSPNDVVYAYPEFFSYPLVFYTGDDLYLGCLLDADTPLPREFVEGLEVPLRREENFPNWVVSFGAHPGAKERLAYFSRAHEHEGRTRRFEYVLRGTLPVFWYETHRPELNLHSFGPRAFTPNERVFVFERTLAESPDREREVAEVTAPP